MWFGLPPQRTLKLTLVQVLEVRDGAEGLTLAAVEAKLLQN